MAAEIWLMPAGRVPNRRLRSSLDWPWNDDQRSDREGFSP